MKANSYSARWFDYFHRDITPARTGLEASFICACSPLPAFLRVLDLCCGMGRHARALSEQGYSVIGVDRDATALARARELGGGATYLQADVTSYRPAHNAYDLVIVMSQSFGHFDPKENRELLARLAASLRPQGRLILDLWNPDFFAAYQGRRDFVLPRGTVREDKRIEDNRLLVHLTYPDGSEDDFEWQLYSPGQIDSLAKSCDLVLLTSCTDFSLKMEPSPAKPRLQFLLERLGP